MKTAVAENGQNAVFRRRFLEIIAAGLCLSACSLAPRAVASIYTLSPGGNITATASAFPVGGTAVDSTSYTFSSSTIDGTVISTVYSGDTSNPYHGLTFTYLLMLSGASTDSASEMTVGSYGGFMTDVSYNPSSDGGVAPSNFTRSTTGSGSTLRFLWSNGGGILPGENGALVVVQTSATSFGTAPGGVIDSQTVNISVLAPVPEPEIGSLVAMGLGALFIFRRRSSK